MTSPAGRRRALLGLHDLPAAAARSDGRGPRRPRLGRRAADRRRQVAVLPGAGARAARAGPGRVAADLADEGSGGHARRQRRAGGALQQLARRPTRRRRSSPACARDATGCSTSRPSGSSATAATASSRCSPSCRVQLRRRRRSALHQPVGARLQARSTGSSARLRQLLPGISVHAYTATATARVRRDIAAQLALTEPARAGRLVRPAEPALPRAAAGHAEAAAARRARAPPRRGGHHLLHVAAGGRRAGRVADRASGIPALPYHAGLSDDERSANQDAFLSERVDVIVATVAFGMGIDRSERALRRARRRAAIARALPAGIGPRRPRRPRGRVPADLLERPTS